MKRHLIASGFGFVLFQGLLGCGSSAEGGARGYDLPRPTEELSIPGLEEKVQVVTDTRGMPHIYAASTLDAFRVQGFLMARDRMGQMEFLRRAVEGRLSEVAYHLSPSLLDLDQSSRFFGYHRLAKQVAASLGPDDPTLRALQAFSQGVTHYIRQVQQGAAKLPGNLPGLLKKELLSDWTPEDSLAIARYMSSDASNQFELDIRHSAASAAARKFFAPDAKDRRLSSRSRIVEDFWSYQNLEPVFTQGPIERRAAPGKRSQGLSRARGKPGPESSSLLPALRWQDRSRESREAWLGGLGAGSNAWAVSGSLTDSGNPMLASDPHLGLDSPPKFWYVHLDTHERGGDLDVQGLALVGVPGVLIGYNKNVAWGLTYAMLDVQDVYQETLIPGTDGKPDAVLWKGQPVPIETIEETIVLSTGEKKTFAIQRSPHHGLILPGSRSEQGALSLAWTGFDPSNELGAMFSLMKSKNLAEAEQALRGFEVGPNNFVIVTSQGQIHWEAPARLPIRSGVPDSFPGTKQSDWDQPPSMVMSGSGERDWTGDNVKSVAQPRLTDPEEGFIVSANNDPSGVTADGNPFGKPVYLGWAFMPGLRAKRIRERLVELTAQGKISRDDLQALQGDSRSALGSRLTPTLVAALDWAKGQAALTGAYPGTLSTRPDAAEKIQQLAQMRDRLAAWTSFRTPAAVEGTPKGQEKDDSVATTLFNATLPRVVALSFADEVQRIGVRPEDRFLVRTLVWAMTDPTRLSSYDRDLGDTTLWDNLDTETQETRNDILLQAMVSALDFLEGRLGKDPSQWRWGELHTLRLNSIIPSFNEFDIPPPGDTKYAGGFPRPGDNFGVDYAGPGLWRDNDFSYRVGPQQRLVVEMTPRGPRAWNALAGGQSEDPTSLHHADEMEYWKTNQAPPLFFELEDVVDHAEQSILFKPGTPD